MSTSFNNNHRWKYVYQEDFITTYFQDFPDQEYYDWVQDLKVDNVSIVLNQKFNSQLVNIMVEGCISML